MESAPRTDQASAGPAVPAEPIELAQLSSDQTTSFPEQVDPGRHAADTSLEQPKQWIPVLLSRWCVSLFIVLSLSLVVAVSTLLAISQLRNGFASVDAILADHGDTWRVSLLWTSLPSLAVTCLGLFWAGIAGAFTDRQPFVCLNRPGGGPARETVMLDYRTTFGLVRWWPAFRNRHWLVGWAQLACLAFSVLGPLAAGLFIAAVGIFQQEVHIVFNSTFNQSAMVAGMDVRRVLDTVTANLVYGASDRPWTDHEHAFRPFYTAFEVAGQSPPTNATSLTAKTVAHSAYLNCAVMMPGPDSDCEITATPEPSDPSTVALVMNATDRGCHIRQRFLVSPLQTVYFDTTTELDCGLAAGYSRLVFTYGHFSPAGPLFLTNISVVSCAVGYRRTHGDLRVTVPGSPQNDGASASGGRKPEILGFRPTEELQDSRDDSFSFWIPFESKLFQSAVFSGTTALATTDFGAAVLYRAAQRQGGGATVTDNSTVLDADVLATSISDVFTSLYLTAMATFGMVGGPLEDATATLETHLTRLFVVPWVAGTVIGVASMIVILAGLILGYVRRHETLLYDEPAGLLAYATLLEANELIDVVRAVRRLADFDGRVVDTVKRSLKRDKKIRRNRQRRGKKGCLEKWRAKMRCTEREGKMGYLKKCRAKMRRTERVGDGNGAAENVMKGNWKMTPGTRPRVVLVPVEDDNAAVRRVRTGNVGTATPFQPIQAGEKANTVEGGGEVQS